MRQYMYNTVIITKKKKNLDRMIRIVCQKYRSAITDAATDQSKSRNDKSDGGARRGGFTKSG